MIRIILLTIIFFGGCSMNNNELSSYIIGNWKSAPKETELGMMTTKATFSQDSTFKVESYFDKNTEPLIIEGKYRLKDSTLYCDMWNKGNPIEVSIKNSQLILKVDNDSPLVLTREK